ncbi:MAG: response regulator, partial [Alphaproteobacteria bacterium]|nr:response regulator [Alphaproteobacteria bacterium]
MQRLRGDPVDAVQLGLPFKLDDDNWSVLMARRITGPGGGFAGIVVACLNLAFFEAFYSSVELPDDGTVTLHRRDGIVLAAAPRRPGLIGSNASTYAPFRMLQANGIEASGVIERVSDGAERIMAVRAHKTLPLVITVSTSLESTLREWQRRGIMLLSGGVPLAALVWWLLSYSARQTRQIEDLLVENREARDAAIAANTSLRAQIEERERTEAALQQAQRLEAIGQLTGGVAHDFNNLLTVLLGNIDLMQARVPGDRRVPDPTLMARLERMRTAAEKGATLTDQLLAFARRQPLHPKPASLNAVITAMTDLLQSAIGSNIRLVEEFGTAVWPVLIDTTQIELVILNLALNARDAMPKGGMLTLRTENVTIAPEDATIDLPAGDYVTVKVIDNGTGMSAEVRAKAFEPFFTTKGPGMGSGLGLSQVYGVARQSGGSARIESCLGEGAVVSVFLPRVEADLTPAPGTVDAPGVVITRGARVLLVDDDNEVRATTELVLQAIGYVVIAAASGAEALTLIEDGTAVDLLVTDVVMPEMSGADLASEVRSRLPALPIIFISGYADPAAVSGRKTLQPLIRKPFRAVDLAQALEQSLSDARKIAAMRSIS